MNKKYEQALYEQALERRRLEGIRKAPRYELPIGKCFYCERETAAKNGKRFLCPSCMNGVYSRYATY